MNVIAIDFDGTITDSTPFPQTGKIREDARYYIPRLHKLGYTLVLWTARNEQYYFEALKLLEEANLSKYFTPISCTERGYTGKIDAKYYIDDRSCIKLDWQEIYKFITKED